MLPCAVVRIPKMVFQAAAVLSVFAAGFAAFAIVGSGPAGDDSDSVSAELDLDASASSTDVVDGSTTTARLGLPAAGADGEQGDADADFAAEASSVEAPTPEVREGSGVAFEALRNDQEKFSRYADVPSARLELAALTEAAGRPDNGTVGDGQFRAACEYSHFSYDDPIVFPGEPGRSHLHMFFGNTLTDAFTTDESLLDSGGGTCNGFELNRSAYWTPALLDGDGNIVVPDAIILYYKSKAPGAVQELPQGLKMVAGNTTAETFTAGSRLHWSCGGNGAAYNLTNRIPDCGGDVINASVQFPNCWDGVNLDAPDHLSHLIYIDEQDSCPGSHPVRLPQISILLYFPGADSVDGWHLSSDISGGFNTGPGATLHADWWGGWNDEAIELWTKGCMQSARNCSYGQTGTDRQLAALNGFQVYEGPNLLALPDGG